MKLFTDYTPWEILEIFSHKNAYYCLQVRANKSTGMKYFRTSMIIETESPSQMKNITIETINRLLHPQKQAQPVVDENVIKTIRGGKLKLFIEPKQENSEKTVNQIKRQRKSKAV
jgi:hypothetical protein